MRPADAALRCLGPCSEAVAACALLALAASAQTWVQRTTAVAPAGRMGHMMTYDSVRQRTVLYSGQWGPYISGPGSYILDTWEWDGARWVQKPSLTFPLPRAFGAMVFDRVRGRSLLFGGYMTGYFWDTWEWDGSTWRDRNPGSYPPARASVAMACDAARGRVVLFGGWDGNTYLSDTWEWDGNNWLRRTAPGPAVRGDHAMAYDAARQRTVMFGGLTGTTPLGDTWEWDGSVWTQRTPVQSAFARAGHRMVYDSAGARVVLFGGYAVRYAGLTETWEWDGTSWSQLQVAAAPPVRLSFDMVYDERRGRIVLFGGHGSSNTMLADTWELVATTAAATPFGAGCGSPALTVTPVAGSRPLLGTTQLTDVTNVPTGGAQMAIGLSRTALGPVALPLPLDPFGLPGCTLYQDNLVPGVPCTPTAQGTAQHRIAIPNDLNLAGVHVYLQAWAPAPGANPAGVVFSNAIDLLLGNM